jgi:DNA-binding NarL/FixJ family response regulator
VPVRILVADDNPSMRAALRLVLEGAGPWEVVEAVNGEQVLDLARTETFGLIILDLAMPVMDGITTARVLSERCPHVPILMHTLYWSERVAVEALKVGVRKVIPKSDKATFLNAVRETLEAGSAKPASLAVRLKSSPEESSKDPVSVDGFAGTEGGSACESIGFRGFRRARSKSLINSFLRVR